LLLDTSSSMSGRPIDMLNRGFELFCDEIKKDDLARKRAEIAVITFGGVARVEIPFTEGRDLQPRRLNASGSTPMGAALDLALDQLAAQKQAYKQAGLEYYRPWLFVLTDGAPTDGQVFTAAAARVRKLRPRPSAIGIRLLPDPIADMFRRAFEDGAANPADRPSALEWQQALSGLDAHLRECGKNQAHIYPDHLGACPWCHHASAAGPVLQQPLPPAKAPARTTSLVAATRTPPDRPQRGLPDQQPLRARCGAGLCRSPSGVIGIAARPSAKFRPGTGPGSDHRFGVGRPASYEPGAGRVMDGGECPAAEGSCGAHKPERDTSGHRVPDGR